MDHETFQRIKMWQYEDQKDEKNMKGRKGPILSEVQQKPTKIKDNFYRSFCTFPCIWTFPTSRGLQHNNYIHSAGSDGLKCCAALATLTEPTSLVHWYYRFKSLLDSPISTTDQGTKWLGNREINQSTWEKIRASR